MQGFVRNTHRADINTKILRTILSHQVIFLLQLFLFPWGGWPPEPQWIDPGCSYYTVLSLEQLGLLQETYLSPGPTCWVIIRLLTHCPILHFGSALKNSPLRKCILNLVRLLWLEVPSFRWYSRCQLISPFQCLGVFEDEVVDHNK